MKECPRCRAGKMFEGFMLDRGESNSKNVQKWIEGEPEKSFWLGVRTKGREAFEVSTWRCDRCGYLESYALTPVK